MTTRVLIVDDSRLARMAVIKGLHRLRPGFAYSEASNPDEAVAAFRADRASIAIIAFNMPVRDGLALAAELLEMSPGMPLALVSANTQEEILNRAAELGATFLTKPLNEAALGAFLEAAEKKLST
jgi:DNA-binding response OmpR family regulator